MDLFGFAVKMFFEALAKAKKIWRETEIESKKPLKVGNAGLMLAAMVIFALGLMQQQRNQTEAVYLCIWNAIIFV